MITFHKPSNQSAANARRNTRKSIAASIKRLNKRKQSSKQNPIPTLTRAKSNKQPSTKLQGRALREHRDNILANRLADCLEIKGHKIEPLYRKTKKLSYFSYTAKGGKQMAEVRYTPVPKGSGFASTKDSSLLKVSIDGRPKHLCKRDRSGEKKPYVCRNKRILLKNLKNEPNRLVNA